MTDAALALLRLLSRTETLSADQNLTLLLNQAWTLREDRMFPEEMSQQVTAMMLTRLRANLPIADMVVLTRHGCTERVTELTVMIYNGIVETWNIPFVMPLFESVIVPLSRPVFYAGGPLRPSDHPTCGVPAPQWATMSGVQRRIYHRELVERERWRLPLDADLYFTPRGRMRRQREDDEHRLHRWVRTYHETHGTLPTWGELALEFTVFEEIMRRA